jgi:hypothetical protein
MTGATIRWKSVQKVTEKPRFLTIRDFEDGSLQCTVGAHEATVYTVTICVPRTIYDLMKDDPTLGKLDMVKNAWPDDENQVVHLCGKIGETTQF